MRCHKCCCWVFYDFTLLGLPYYLLVTGMCLLQTAYQGLQAATPFYAVFKYGQQGHLAELD